MLGSKESMLTIQNVLCKWTEISPQKLKDRPLQFCPSSAISTFANRHVKATSAFPHMKQ
jgi:hypothetical protein